MFVACSTLCFGKLPFEEALRVIREMRFAKADLAFHAEGPHWRPADILADVGRAAQKLRAANLAYAAFHVAMDPGPDALPQLRAISRLARVLAVPLITVPASPAGSDLAAEVTRLKEWVTIAEHEGLILTVDTQADTLTADPLGAMELCRQVPGLGITLDPSCYQNGPHAPQNFDCLMPLVRHVRLRDTGKAPDQFQVRVGQGEIEYGRIITQLEHEQYDRTLTVDIRDIPDGAFPIEPEVRKLKYLLESLV